MTFHGKLDEIMRKRDLTNEEVAKKLKSPQSPTRPLSAAYFGRLRDGTRSPSEFVLDEVCRAFGPEDGAALRQAFAEDKTPSAIRAELVAARARAETSISEADKLYFPSTFQAPHREAARKLVAAIFSALDVDPAWLAPAVARFEGAAFAALDANNARIGGAGAGGGSATPPLQARAQGA